MSWTRVKDKETGHEYSVEVVDPEAHEVLTTKDGADRFGNPLPAKLNRPLSSITNEAGKPVSSMILTELEDYAEKHQIDLGGASKKDDVLAVIAAHEGDPTPAA